MLAQQLGKTLAPPYYMYIYQALRKEPYLWNSCLKLDVGDWSRASADNGHYYHTYTRSW